MTDTSAQQQDAGAPGNDTGNNKAAPRPPAPDPIPWRFPVREGARPVPVHPTWCHYHMTYDGTAELFFMCRRRFFVTAWSRVMFSGPLVSLALGFLITLFAIPDEVTFDVWIGNVTHVFLTGTVVSVSVGIVFWLASFALVYIRVFEDRVTLNFQSYDRRYFRGLRLGTAADQKPSAKPHKDISIAYGMWGYPTSWVIDSRRAVTTLTWVGWVLRLVNEGEASHVNFDPSRGIRNDGLA